MRVLLAGLGFLACVGLQAEENLAGFWQRGRVRELLVSGIDGVSLPQWRDAGVNCVMGVKPEEAHKLGLKTRTWFTLNLIDPRAFGNDTARIQALCAVNADGWATDWAGDSRRARPA